MNNELIAAETAWNAASEALAVAIAEADRIAERVAAGDETLTIAETMTAPAAVKVAEAKLTAAARRLRAAEDEQPLPAIPALHVEPSVAEAGQVLAKASKAAETARAGLLRAEHALLTAEGKLTAAEGKLEAAVSSDPGPAVHLAELLIASGAMACDVEVAPADADLPKRSSLPLLRVAPGGGRRVLLTHYGRFEDDGVPDGREIARVLSLDGWRNVPWSLDVAESADGSILASTSIIDLEPRAVAAWAQSEDVNGETGHDLLDGMDELASEVRWALRGDNHSVKVFTHSHRAPLSLDIADDGLYRVTVGVAVNNYTNGSLPLDRGAAYRKALGKFWQALIGATDWSLGVVANVEPVSGTPAWAGQVPINVPTAREQAIEYAELECRFRMAEGRDLKPNAFGLG